MVGRQLWLEGVFESHGQTEAFPKPAAAVAGGDPGRFIARWREPRIAVQSARKGRPPPGRSRTEVGCCQVYRPIYEFLKRAEVKHRPAEKRIMSEVTGEFDVKVVPAEMGDDKMGMMTLDKQYHGDLNATGQGRMLSA